MSPTIEIGDVVIVKITKEIKQNDIIVYIDCESIITHRLIEKDEEQLTTRGDANNSEDKPIEENMVLGRVIKIIPQLGTWRKIFAEPDVAGLIILMIVILSIVFIYSSKSEEKEEEIKK